MMTEDAYTTQKRCAYSSVTQRLWRQHDDRGGAFVLAFNGSISR